MSEVNEVMNMKIGGQWFRRYVIRELFCYLHPVGGHIVKKSYANQTIMTTGRVPGDAKKRAALIESQKRQIERANVQATAAGCPPIVEFWWEKPGPTGRFTADGLPL